MSSTRLRKTRTAAGLATAGLLASGVLATGVAVGSSHREAPLITQMPKIDATDFYMFRSYEPGRANFVTFLANYQPLQAPYGGPNYFLMDPHALYAIHIDNDGDAIEDISYFFRFYNQQRALTVPVNGMDIPVPLSNIGAFGDTTAQDGNRNVSESYVVVSSRNGRQAAARNLGFGGYLFAKPSDNIGRKSIPNYSAYAGRHITRIGVDQCATEGRVFAGQRKEGFAVNLGEVFDLVNTNPVGPPDGEKNTLEDANVTTIALELPIACLTANGPIIGAWTAAYRRLQPDGPYVQLSRLSAPLVNEVVIGLPDKDRFNGSHPAGDASFAKYVTNPSLPILLQALFGVRPPTQYPRTDLVAAFLTGVGGLNQPANVRPAEMMRLNTSIAPRPALTQQSLGVLAGDTAGFPNGRRPGDDVVDIELRVAMGALLPANVAPDGQLPYTDGAWVSARGFSVNFPYLGTPLPGSPN